jgi:ABC-three component (ABC-3C) system Middle Component 5
MIQLTFQPAFDPFHAVFRLLRLRPTIAVAGSLHRDHVRILDFYLLFPFKIDGIRLLPEDRKYRRLSSDYQAARTYGHQPGDQIVFNRMATMQTAAIETLAVRNMISRERLDVGHVEATSAPAPKELAVRVGAANERDAELMGFLAVLASRYALTGPDGLKARTNLLEYRYDAV